MQVSLYYLYVSLVVHSLPTYPPLQLEKSVQNIDITKYCNGMMAEDSEKKSVADDDEDDDYDAADNDE